MQSFSDKIFWVNIFSFLISLHYAVIVYSESTYLSKVFGAENIWVIYTCAASLTILLNFQISRFLRKRHIEKIVKTTLVLAFINLINLFFSISPLTSFLSFIIYTALSQFLFLLSSIVLEEFSKESTTGGVRGKYISIQSLGYLAAPLISSFFIKYFGIESIFVISSLFILLSLYIFNTTLNKIPRIVVPETSIFKTLKRVWRSVDLRNIIFAQIGLYIFYALVVIYIPFKLGGLGISLTQYLGVLLPVALLPFLFVPEILGYVEDKMKDEKEFLMFSILGLIIILILMAYTTSNSLLVWAFILFVSRFFASMMETSVSSYFFKKVGKSDTDLISIFTSSHNLVYLFLVPVFALILKQTDLQTLFLSVSFFLCFVLVLVSKIHNTKNYDEHKTWAVIWQRSKKRTASSTN